MLRLLLLVLLGSMGDEETGLLARVEESLGWGALRWDLLVAVGFRAHVRGLLVVVLQGDTSWVRNARLVVIVGSDGAVECVLRGLLTRCEAEAILDAARSEMVH